MLEAGMDGSFEESDYNESELSKLEAKWKRYLTSSSLSRQKIEQEQKNIKELVSNISHQTRTPLSNILLYTQLLQECPLDEESRKIAGQIAFYSEKLEFLIQALVKASQLETGTFQFMPKKNSLQKLALAAADEGAKKSEEKNITVDIRVDKEHQATFDSKWTKEAVYNILDNAIKYSPNNSTVLIKSRMYPLFSCLEIVDEGIGIAEDEIPKIFGRFYRSRHVHDQEGVGIGLYLSRQIIESQGGYIKTASKLHSGSRFQIYLPVR